MINRPGKDAEASSDDRAVQSFMKQRHPEEMTSAEISEGMKLPPGRVWGALNRLSDRSTMLKKDGHRWKASSG
jgi:hypothetical protein